MSLLNELAKAITKKFAFMEFPLSMSRQGDFPLDKSSLWWDLQEATTYAKSNPTAYPGQPITVVDEASNTVTLYIVGTKGELVAQGGMASVDALKKELTAHKADYDKLKAAYDQTKADVQQLRTDHDALNEKHTALDGKVTTLSGKHDKLQQDHTTLDDKVTTLSGKHDTLQGAHDALNTKHEALQKAHDTLAADEAALKKSHEALEGKHTTLQQTVTALDAHEKQLKKDHDALKQSFDTHVHTADDITETATRVFVTPELKTKLQTMEFATNADIDALFPELNA